MIVLGVVHLTENVGVKTKQLNMKYDQYYDRIILFKFIN
jgi:hypothetical protein